MPASGPLIPAVECFDRWYSSLHALKRRAAALPPDEPPPERKQPGQPSRDAWWHRKVAGPGPFAAAPGGSGGRGGQSERDGQAASGLPIFSTASCTRAVIGAKAVSASFTDASFSFAASDMAFSIAVFA